MKAQIDGAASFLELAARFEQLTRDGLTTCRNERVLRGRGSLPFLACRAPFWFEAAELGAPHPAAEFCHASSCVGSPVLIRRRLLVNFRVDAEVMRRFLPAPFRPKLHAGYAVAGICLIRISSRFARPGFRRFAGFPARTPLTGLRWFGMIHLAGPRRGSLHSPARYRLAGLNHLAGGRVFPGEHHHADFQASTDDGHPHLDGRPGT